ncbi:hypothetical protein WA577_002528, partial [Blastocystis sp. JDR]
MARKSYSLSVGSHSLSSSSSNNAFVPGPFSGIHVNGRDPYNTALSLDRPSLSIAFWFHMDPGSTGISVIVGNREIDCTLGRQNVGVSIYIDHDKQQLVVLWRSRNRQCESVTLTPSLPENAWTHFAVVFKQVDTHGQGEFDDSDEYLSPTKITCFVNGALSATATSNRFFSYDHTYFVGSTPSGLHPFSGRLFYLMIVTTALTAEEVEGLCQGRRAVVQSVSAFAALTLATEFVDSVARKREEELSMEVRNVPEMMAHLTETYRAKRVFKQHSTAFTDFGSAALPPLAPWTDHLVQNRSVEAAPAPQGALKAFVEALLAKDDAAVRSGQAWFTVPGRLVNEYALLSEHRARHVRDCFEFAWWNYKQFAWGHDEVRPVSGGWKDTWGGVGLTLIDGLDTAWVMGFRKEVEAAKATIEKMDFRVDREISVFESIIRLVGGLLALYDASGDRVFLKKARELADLLAPAFDTDSGYPKSVLNPRTGEASIVSWTHGKAILSEVGSLSVEFMYLSKATWRPKYRRIAERIYKSLEKAATRDGLLPTYLDVRTGGVGGDEYTMGAMADSYYEYLLKAWIAGGKKDKRLQRMYNRAMDGMMKNLVRTSKEGLVHLGTAKNPHEMGLLECFVGGMLALGVLHDVNPAQRERDLSTAKALTYTCMRFYFDSPTGVASELNLVTENGTRASFSGRYYIFRPEAIESLFYLNQITGDPLYREWGWKAWEAVERETRARYGFGHLKDATKRGMVEDATESFLFAETLKYLYLLLKDEQIVDLTHQVFNTEAHVLSF